MVAALLVGKEAVSLRLYRREMDSRDRGGERRTRENVPGRGKWPGGINWLYCLQRRSSQPTAKRAPPTPAPTSTSKAATFSGWNKSIIYGEFSLLSLSPFLLGIGEGNQYCGVSSSSFPLCGGDRGREWEASRAAGGGTFNLFQLCAPHHRGTCGTVV